MSYDARHRAGPDPPGSVVSSARLRRLSLPLLLLFVFLIFFAQPIFRSRVFYVWDLGTMTLPNLVANATIRAREGLPLWNPWTKFGYPMSAESEVGALYPPALLLNLPLGHGQAFTLYILFHYLLAMAGTWLFARELGLSSRGRATAVLVFVFSGSFIAQTVNAPLVTTFAWAPLILALQLRANAEKKLCWAALGGVCLGVQLLGAHPQMVLYQGLMTLVNGVVHRGRLPTRREIGWAGSVLAVLYGVGVGLGAPQLLYNYELLGFTRRVTSPSYDFAVSFSLPPHYLLQLLFPNLLGLETAYAGAWDFYEMHAFWSLTALGLVAVGCLRGGNRHRAYFGFFLVGFLVLACGRFVLAYHLLWHVPGFNVIRAPARMLLPASLCAGVLAGIGVDALSRAESTFSAAARWLAAAYLGLAICQMALGGAGLLAGGARGTYRYLMEMPGEPQDGAPAQATSLLISALHSAGRSALVASAFSLVCAAWWYFLGRRTARRPALVPVLIVLVAAELVVFESGVNRYERRDFFERRPALVALLCETPGLFRVHPRTDDDSLHPDLGNLPATSPALFGLASTETALSLEHTRIATYLGGEVPLRRLSVANVRFLVSSVARSEAGLREVARDDGRLLYELPDVQPRAFFAGRIEVIRDERRLLARLDDESFSPADTALLEENPTPELHGRIRRGGPLVVQVAEYGALRVRVHVSTAEAGMLVLSDLYFPGWTASVDGEEKRIYRTNYLFRGVRLSPGVHDVVFRYRPRSFFVGLGVAGGVLVVLAVWTSLAGARRLEGRWRTS